jgi:hypothetical protein
MAQDEVAMAVAAGLHERLRASSLDVHELGRYLDGLAADARLVAVRSLTGAQQALLHEAAKGARKLTLEDLVPSATAPLGEVTHEGKNSLLLFSRFAKVFCRPKPDSQEVWGYNRAGGFVQTVVGPGYFVAYEGPGDEVLVDYTRLPKGKASSWPEIMSNEARLSRFVYSGMIDALRGVSSHVSVGRAIRNGKVQDNWFVLCRQDR